MQIRSNPVETQKNVLAYIKQ